MSSWSRRRLWLWLTADRFSVVQLVLGALVGQALLVWLAAR